MPFLCNVGVWSASSCINNGLIATVSCLSWNWFSFVLGWNCRSMITTIEHCRFCPRNGPTGEVTSRKMILLRKVCSTRIASFLFEWFLRKFSSSEGFISIYDDNRLRWSFGVQISKRCFPFQWHFHSFVCNNFVFIYSFIVPQRNVVGIFHSTKFL